MFSMFLFWKDVLTDLKADAEILPLNPPIETWVGHKVKHVVLFKKNQECPRLRRCVIVLKMSNMICECFSYV